MLIGSKDEESLKRKEDPSQRSSSFAEEWIKIDSQLQDCIQFYYELKSEVNGVMQTSFIDLIVRLFLYRVYANDKCSKILTAEKLLGIAFKIIEALKNPDNPLVIVGCKGYDSDQYMIERQQAQSIPIEILEQYYYMHRGMLMISFNRDQNKEAKESFIKALNIGPQYDIRIRKACVEEL